MKLEYNDFCQGISCLIDSKDINELPIDKVREAMKLLIDKCTIGTIQDMFINALVFEGKYEDMGYCEQCGSSNSSYTINLK